MLTRVCTFLFLFFISLAVKAQITDECLTQIAQHHFNMICDRHEDIPEITYFKLDDQVSGKGVHALILTPQQFLDQECLEKINDYVSRIDQLGFILNVKQNDGLVDEAGVLHLNRECFPPELTEICITNVDRDVTALHPIDYDHDGYQQMIVTFDDHLLHTPTIETSSKARNLEGSNDYYTRIIDSLEVKTPTHYMALGEEPNDAEVQILILKATELLDKKNHTMIQNYVTHITNEGHEFGIILDLERGDGIVTDTGVLELRQSMIPACITNLYLSNLAKDVTGFNCINDEDEDREMNVAFDTHLQEIFCEPLDESQDISDAADAELVAVLAAAIGPDLTLEQVLERPKTPLPGLRSSNPGFARTHHNLRALASSENDDDDEVTAASELRKALEEELFATETLIGEAYQSVEYAQDHSEDKEVIETFESKLNEISLSIQRAQHYHNTYTAELAISEEKPDFNFTEEVNNALASHTQDLYEFQEELRALKGSLDTPPTAGAVSADDHWRNDSERKNKKQR